LSQSGLVPTNNLLDFQNYILLETGYPFEFYDLNKIQSKIGASPFTLKLVKATIDEEFCGSNDLTYKLNDSIVTLKANDFTLSIGGILPHKQFSYTPETKSLLIEASIFNSTKIRQQSRILGLRTDRSARYEKSLKSDFLIESLYQLINLLKITNRNLTCKLRTCFKSKQQKLFTIDLTYKTVNDILGSIKGYTKINTKYISPTMICNYLNRLKFNYKFDSSKLIWKVEIPNSRSDDITRQIDLIEEIGRLHGFNNFLTTLPQIKKIGIEDKSYQTRKKITSCLLNAGFNELMHYSLVNEKTFLKNEIKLINPLLTDCSNLRSSLLPNLIKTVTENEKQGNSYINGFEYGHIFSGSSLTNFKETECISGIFGGTKTKLEWSEAAKCLTWFEGKGKLELLFQQLDIAVQWKPYLNSDYNQILHPYRTARLCLKNEEDLGIFGQIHPILSKQLGISSDLLLFELNFYKLKEQIQNNKLASYSEYSLYPKIIKDLSFVVKQTVTFEEIQKILFANGTKFLTEVNLLDEYKGKSIPENHLSLCLQLVFQSNKKTLENKEVENIINQLQLLLKESFNVQIRT
jgi:phenylalanyl-tRNA synthetase beta chain